MFLGGNQGLYFFSFNWAERSIKFSIFWSLKFSIGLAFTPFTTIIMSVVAWAMEVLCFFLLWLLLDPVGSSPVGGEPYSWRRPVPGWRQSEESVTLENQGFHFEPAEFEAHFRDQGMLQSCLYVVVDQ